MKRISPKQRALGLGLLLALGSWAADRFFSGTAPQPAQASPRPVGAPTSAPIGWGEVDELVTRLTRASRATLAEALNGLDRDLFLPTPTVEAALGPVEPPVATQPVGAAAKIPPEADFAARHKLLGVVIGSERLAVIDDQLLPLFSELDGYTLSAVERDYVLFRHPETQQLVRLELERQPRDR